MKSAAAAGTDHRARFRAAWARSDVLFSCLVPEALNARPIALRHPFLFYLGHLPAFAWNQVARGALGRPAFHAEFDRLFERGIDPRDERSAAASRRESWPDVDHVLAYRDAVRAALEEAFDLAEQEGSGDPLLDRGRVLRLVLEHERMHHETLLYMVQALDARWKRAPDGFAPAAGARGAPPTTVEIPAGKTVLGADFDRADFGWDNEFPETVVAVPAFSIDACPVTNAEFAAFVAEDGYVRDDLWSPEGAAWRRAEGLRRPRGWRDDAGRISVRTPFSEVSFEQARDWPVQVACVEAEAYARWRGRRLPTEPEVHRAAYTTPDGDDRSQPWGDDPVGERRANADFVRWTPEPVGRRPAGRSAWGVEELVGNGWEWTSTPFAPFPGFRAWARTYPGYSADFFDGGHRVVLGASFATDASLVRRSFRNWYRPAYPYVFSKFRTAASA